MSLSTKIYSDKTFIRFLCRVLYFCGLGDCWYEPLNYTWIAGFAYNVWFFVSNFYIVTVILSEIATSFKDDLTVKERNDNLQFIVAHSTVYTKSVMIFIQRRKIKVFFKKLIEGTRIPFTEYTNTQAIRKSKIFIAVLCLTMYAAVLLNLVDGIRYHYIEGIPVRTLVVYWPSQKDSGVVVEIIRVLVQLAWWFIITAMLAVDSLCLTALIFLGYRFRTLQIYFESLKTNFIKNADKKSKNELEDDLKMDFVRGINFHSEMLWCARSLQNALGNVYSAQVVQSIGLIAVCLIKLVRIERNLTFLIANLSSIVCLVTLTGCYMMAAGDITYEASRVSTSMFHGGWELCRPHARLRPLLVVALQCSNRPVVMTAFGVYDLSYKNFISVIRTSYSFFAVMY